MAWPPRQGHRPTTTVLYIWYEALGVVRNLRSKEERDEFFVGFVTPEDCLNEDEEVEFRRDDRWERLNNSPLFAPDELQIWNTLFPWPAGDTISFIKDVVYPGLSYEIPWPTRTLVGAFLWVKSSANVDLNHDQQMASVVSSVQRETDRVFGIPRVELFTWWKSACRDDPLTLLKAMQLISHVISVLNRFKNDWSIRTRPGDDTYLNGKETWVETLGVVLQKGDITSYIGDSSMKRLGVLDAMCWIRISTQKLEVEVDEQTSRAIRFYRIVSGLAALRSYSELSTHVNSFARGVFDVQKYRQGVLDGDVGMQNVYTFPDGTDAEIYASCAVHLRMLRGFVTYANRTACAHALPALMKGPLLVFRGGGRQGDERAPLMVKDAAAVSTSININVAATYAKRTKQQHVWCYIIPTSRELVEFGHAAVPLFFWSVWPNEEEILIQPDAAWISMGSFNLSENTEDPAKTAMDDKARYLFAMCGEVRSVVEKNMEMEGWKAPMRDEEAGASRYIHFFKPAEVADQAFYESIANHGKVMRARIEMGGDS